MTASAGLSERRQVDLPPPTNPTPIGADWGSTEPEDPAPQAGSESVDDSDVVLETLIYERLSTYVDSLQGHAPVDLYRLIMPQLERPLIRLALKLAGGERQRAAKMLGIHRNTLRTRIRALGLEAD